MFKCRNMVFSRSKTLILTTDDTDKSDGTEHEKDRMAIGAIRGIRSIRGSVWFCFQRDKMSGVCFAGQSSPGDFLCGLLTAVDFNAVAAGEIVAGVDDQLFVSTDPVEHHHTGAHVASQAHARELNLV